VRFTTNVVAEPKWLPLFALTERQSNVNASNKENLLLSMPGVGDINNIID
jgi:hypothetical protein